MEADALSWILWHKTQSGYSDLDPVMVRAIIGGCTNEIPLIEVFAGKAVIPFPKKNFK